MIYVFKTSVKTLIDVIELTDRINEFIPNSFWNFDLEDCDNIFRIDISVLIPEEVVLLFEYHGYFCEELLD